jgi:Tfp pilus assembly protein PilF
VRLVRIEAARTLADVPPPQVAGEARAAWDQAHAELIASEQAQADMPPTQLNLAGLALRRGDVAAAEAGYRRALAMDPYLEPAYNALASFLSSQRRNADAESVLRAGVARVPDNGHLHHSLGLLLAEEKRLPEAIAQAEQAAKLLPGEARVFYNLGLMQQQQGRLPQAEAALGRARALGDNEAGYALALLYVRQGRPERALPLAEELARANPDHPDFVKLRDRLRSASGAKQANPAKESDP